MVELTGRSLLPYLGAASRRSGQLWKQAGLAVGLLVVAVALVGCSAVIQQGKDVEVTKVQFVKFWAFTVESGILKCLNETGRRKGEAILDVNGVTYALNETAEKAGHSPIDVIVADNPNFEGSKINYHKFIELAEEECF
jgi:hypothetical protein